ncbi:MAG: hypothetical protein PHP45_01205 [Elusimicrobiales bacterium]|nr:hypothetical protein [Elusimicrobiales bacterium]
MTKQEMQKHLKALGLKKSFKPYAEPESSAFMLETRKPAQIVDGLLRGSEICLQGKLFRVWTSRKRLAHDFAKQHGLKVRLLDGEAELWVPSELADVLLSLFGAKVKKVCAMSQEQRQALCAKMRLARKNPL